MIYLKIPKEEFSNFTNDFRDFEQSYPNAERIDTFNPTNPRETTNTGSPSWHLVSASFLDIKPKYKPYSYEFNNGIYNANNFIIKA